MIDEGLYLEATPEDLRAIQRKTNPRIWTVERGRISLPKSGGQVMSFEDYPFMIDVYEDLHEDIIIRKGAQTGFTTWSMARTFWMLSEFSCTVIYTFPTVDLVSEFTASRIDPIIDGSQYLRERIVDVNSVKLKKFQRYPKGTLPVIPGISLVYFRGAAKESDAISVDADLLVHDEEDKSNARVIEQYKERLTASKWKNRIRLSTPTIPNFGVDKAYALSDRRKWLIRCPGCNEQFELWFPKNPEDHRSNIEPYTWLEVENGRPARYRCHLCGHTLTDDDRRTRGSWVAERPDRGLPHGYALSQLAAPWISAGEILFKQHDATWPRDFWNLAVGIAWESGVAAMTMAAILKRAVGPRRQDVGNTCYLGVDVQGSTLELILEQYNGDGKPSVVEMKRIPWHPDNDFGELDKVMEDYEVTNCVMDLYPETGMAKRFAARWNRPGMTRVWLSTFKTATANASSRRIDFEEPKWDPTSNAGDREAPASVKSVRDELLTTVSEELLDRLILPQFDESADYKAFIEHCKNSKREPVFKDDQAKEKEVDHYVWIKTGPDHLFLALAYAYLARLAPRALATAVVGLISTNRGSGGDDHGHGVPSIEDYHRTKGVNLQRMG